LDEVPDAPLEDGGDEPEKAAQDLPIPEDPSGEEGEDLEEKMGELSVTKE
jgi:hypothetical protein